jgi:Flp pilus assembly protein protease CpaA
MWAAVDTAVFWLFLLYAMLIACDLILQGWRGGRGLGIVVPNWVPLILIIALVAKLASLQSPMGVVAGHVAIGIGMLLLTFLLFMKSLLSGGFAKLASTVLAYLGPEYLLQTLTLVLVIIGLGAVAGAIVRRTVSSPGP